MDADYLTDIIILLAAAVAAVPLFRILGLGAVPGFLVAGVIVGPSGLGFVTNVKEIGHLSELGVVLLLFFIGIEVKPSRLWLMRREVFGLGALQLVVTGAVISGVIHLLLGISIQAAVLIGPALALSSTAFVLQLLTEQRMLVSEYGRVSIAVLLLQDVAVVPLLVLVSLLTKPQLTVAEDISLAVLEALAILGLVIVGGRYLLHPVLHRVARYGTPEVFTASAVLLVLGAAVVMEKIGLSMAMGAFIAGLLIADSAFRHHLMAEIQPFRGLLIGLFFMSMGMSLDLNRFFEQPWVSLSLMAALMLGKAAVLWPLAHRFGLDVRTALAVALLLAQSGEFALVLFPVAYSAGLFDEALFQQLLGLVVLSMLATPLLARLAYALMRPHRRSRVVGRGEALKREETVPAPIVLAGFGRVGHRIGQLLEFANIPYLALDNDPAVVAQERGMGHRVFFGDAQRPEILQAVGAGNARVVVVTIDDFEATERVVSSLHQAFPELKVFARGHDLAHCRELRLLGASAIVSENLQASLELARVALVQVGVADNEIAELAEHFRRNYYAQVDEAVRSEGRAQGQQRQD